MNHQIQTTLLLVIFATFILFSTNAWAQDSENQLFYIQSDGVGFVNSIQSVDLDQSETSQLWSSSVTFTSGYHIADEDSVILFNNRVVYKADRQFRTFRPFAELPSSFGNLYSDYLAADGSIFYTSNSNINKLLPETDETTTIIAAEGDIEGLSVSGSGAVYWAENQGFGNRFIRSFTADGDTLEHHSITSGTFGSILVSSSDDELYFVQDNFSSYTLNQIDLETGEITILHTSSGNIINVLLDESSDKLYMILSSDRTTVLQLDLSAAGSPEEIYSGPENIGSIILDEVSGSIVMRTLDGVFEYRFDSGETARLTVPGFYNGVLAADPVNEYLYFVTEGMPHQLIRTDFSGAEYTSLKEFNVMGTTFKRAQLDLENNDLYLIDSRRLYRMNLDDDETEETILTLDFGNSMEGFAVDPENDAIYYYLDRDGIYRSDLNGEGYERISSGLGFGTGGIAYDGDREKIYFSSGTWIYAADNDGSDRENFHDRFDGFVPDIQYNSVREQIVFIDRNMSGTDRLRYRSTGSNGDPAFGVYHSAPSITAFAALLSPGDVVETSSERIVERPVTTRLNQNYPNPFNPSTVISYRVASSTNVTLDVFDMTGRHVATLVNEPQSAGEYEVQFDGSQLSSGIYLYRLTAGETVQTRKLSLIK